jgi:hypothetical protein
MVTSHTVAPSKYKRLDKNTGDQIPSDLTISSREAPNKIAFRNTTLQPDRWERHPIDLQLRVRWNPRTTSFIQVELGLDASSTSPFGTAWGTSLTPLGPDWNWAQIGPKSGLLVSATSAGSGHEDAYGATIQLVFQRLCVLAKCPRVAAKLKKKIAVSEVILHNYC